MLFFLLCTHLGILSFSIAFCRLFLFVANITYNTRNFKWTKKRRTQKNKTVSDGWTRGLSLSLMITRRKLAKIVRVLQKFFKDLRRLTENYQNFQQLLNNSDSPTWSPPRSKTGKNNERSMKGFFFFLHGISRFFFCLFRTKQTNNNKKTYPESKCLARPIDTLDCVGVLLWVSSLLLIFFFFPFLVHVLDFSILLNRFSLLLKLCLDIAHM